jgi:aspartate aminotransferase
VELSARVKQLAPSATLAVSAKAAELKSQGIDVVSFGAGEPDFDTPENIKSAAKAALDRGETKYAKPASGIPSAKQAVVAKLKRENALSYEPGQVLLTVGGKEALHLACQTLIDPGDEVILPVPYWVTYPEQIRLAGGKVVEVVGDEANNFCLTTDQIAAAITPKTKAFIFNSPSNPGGFTYSPAQVREIAGLFAGKEIVVFSDEMYDRLVYEGQEFLSFAATGQAAYDQTLTFNAGSKTYSMTGWRCGYVAGPQAIIKGMSSLQSQTTSGTATFVQHALAEALTGDQSAVERMRQAFEKRAAHIHRRLNALPGVTCCKPTGAFYAFPNVSGTFSKLGVTGSLDFSARILEEAHVAVVPGIAFGSDANVRMSFASSMENIDKGLDRVAKFLG